MNTRKIIVEPTPVGIGYMAYRDEYDEGEHVAFSMTKEAAVEGLLEWEAMKEDEDYLRKGAPF